MAFNSYATNLVANHSNQFAHDFTWTFTSDPKIVGVSVTTGGRPCNGANADTPVISGDGNVVAFSSDCSNLVEHDMNRTSDVFVHNMRTGMTNLVSVDAAGHQGNGPSWGPTISLDGRFVAFSSDATNLVSGDTNKQTDVFVRDLQANQTERVSLNSTQRQAVGGYSYHPSISGDGRYVAFESTALNLDPNGGAGGAIYVRDRVGYKTVLVSVSIDGKPADGPSVGPSIDGEGDKVAFRSGASNLVAGDTNHQDDIFVRDLRGRKTVRVSVSNAGRQSNGDSDNPSISSDGRFVVFDSFASNLVPADTNDSIDVFITDLDARLTKRISVEKGGVQADGDNQHPSISRDDRFVVFDSTASNLTGLPTALGRSNIVLIELATGTVRVPAGLMGAPVNGESHGASLDGYASPWR